MRHLWIAENSEVFLSHPEATELINFGKVWVPINVDVSKYILCDICGVLLKEDTINDECPDRDD